MTVRIHPVQLGFDRCYILQAADGAIMIDGGMPKQTRSFTRTLERLSIRPGNIRLIVLTHGHWDHIGSVGEIKKLTGAPIALHGLEKDWLEKSLISLPPGVTPWGRLFVNIMAAFMPFVHIDATDVDIVLDEAEFSLAEYGIPGRIIYTPGHSMGSVSVMLDTGDAFVGDLAMNEFPLCLSPGLPILAEDMQKVKESWKVLLDKGAKTIYPAHGKPFSAEIIRNALL
ncbi:MAG: MBL fold metallo-hydrolase [Deltaproteobacteria bacterium]|nr:MBL fold metallo-hydrolase [Deltaproteobacteria bacterium]